MKLAIPTIEFTPGRILCLHIPHGFDITAGDAFERDIMMLALLRGKSAAVCPPAGFETLSLQRKLGGLSRLINQHVWRRDPQSQLILEWFSRAAGISGGESAQIIAGLGERVGQKLNSNVGAPRSLLGIAAKLVQEPEVVIYATRALDPDGCQKVHQFVASRCNRVCAVHISYPSIYGDGTSHPRICPPGAECIEVVADSSGSNHG